MEKKKILKTAKEFFRLTASVLLVTLGVMLAVEIVDSLYNLRMLLCVLAGAFLVNPLYKQLGKIRSLKG